MITVVFHFTDWDQYPGVENPQSMMYKWIHNSLAFDVYKLIMIDCSTYKIGQYYNHVTSDILFERYNSLEDAMNAYPDGNWVFIELDEKAFDMKDFQHPENPFYVVGPNYGDVTSSIEPKYWLRIPTVKNYPLFDETALMITLYDRTIKNI
jgi:hypothetical protein